MITTPVRVSNAQAGDYYYFDSKKENAEWGGELADDFKLSGRCSEADFLTLTNGYNLTTNEKLSVNAGDPERFAGEDFTFTLSKNASVLAVYDDRIRKAFDESVNETLKIMSDRYAQTQTRTGGKLKAEHTGNMIYTKFTHYESRNGDPELHKHVFIHNYTKDAKGNIKAMDFKELYSNKVYMGVVQENILFHKLEDLGYKLDIDRNKGMSDIHLNDTSIKDTFSSRQKEIDAKMADIRERYPNMSEKEQRQIAQKETRATKEHNRTLKEIKEQVESKANQEQLKNIKSAIYEAKHEKKQIKEIDLKAKTDEAVKNSIKDLSENSRIFKYEQVENKALRKNYAIGDIEAIKQSIQDNKDLIKLANGRYTTKEIKAVVRDNINTLKTNAESKKIANKEQIDNAIKAFENKTGRKLTDGQKEAVSLLSTDKKFNVIQGDAGTGKTTSFKLVKEIAEKNGYNVIGIAPTAKATNELKAAGIEKTYTIAGLKENNVEINDKTLLIIDESSMIGDKQAEFLIKQTSAKSIFAGDVKQFQSIERGEFFKEAQENIDKSCKVNMTEAKRFKTEHQKELAEAVARKQYDKALSNLETNKSIKEFANADQKLKAITEHYIENIKAGKDTIIIAEMNYDKNQLNEAVRKQLIENNLIDKKSISADVNFNKNLDATAKGFTESYNKGDYLVFNKNYKIDDEIFIARGTKAEISRIDGDKLYLNTTATGIYKDDSERFNRIKQQGEYELNLSDKNKGNFSVWEKKNIDLSIGDEIVFLKNDKSLDVQNGRTGKIQDIDFDKKILTVESGDKTIKVDLNKYNSIDYGYALTNYKAQGATKQETLYSVGRDLREDSFYVLSTRATDNTNIYGTQEEIKGFKENINDFKQGEDIMQSFNNTQNITESITPPAQEYKISL